MSGKVSAFLVTLGLTAVLLFANLRLHTSDVFSDLLWRNPLPTGNSMQAVAFGNGTFVALAGYEILTSPDGIDWTTRTSATTNALRDVIYVQNRFVAVGDGGAVCTSADGVMWTNQPSTLNVNLTHITYGAGRLMASSGGISGGAYYSEDLINWSTSLSGEVRQVTYGAGKFVVFLNGTTNVLVSNDGGLQWSTNSLGLGFRKTLNPFALGYGNGLFIVAGDEYGRFGFERSVILKSTDAVEWQLVPVSDGAPRAVGFGPELYVVAGAGFGSGCLLQTSPDATQWFKQPANLIPHSLSAIAYGSGRFVAVGNSGGVVFSTNGLNWFAASGGENKMSRGIAFGHAGYIAVGEGVLGSKDGFEYSLRSTHTGSDVVYGNGAYVATAGGSEVLESTNGFQWNLRSAGSTGLRSIAFANNSFVAVGAGGAIQVSPNGRAWSGRFSGANQDLNGVAYGTNGWIAVGGSGTVLTSPDTVTWSGQSSDTLNLLTDVAFGNGQYVAVGAAGTILTSFNSEDWSVRNSGVTAELHSVAFGAGVFAVMGNLGNGFLFSTNGVDWKRRPLPIDPGYPYPHVAFVNDTFVFMGTGGMILQTPSDTIALAGKRLEDAFQITVRGGRSGSILQLQKCVGLSSESWQTQLIFTNTLPLVRLLDQNDSQAALYRVVSPSP